MKVSVVDVMVIIVVGVSLFSFSTKYEPKYEFTYSGSQIYKVVRECDILDSTGFLYTVFVKGYWNYDVGHFEGEGFVTNTGRGYIEMVLRDGTIVTVGGKMGYKEDIQAVDVNIYLKNKSSVVYVLKPKRGSQNEIKEYITDSAQFIDYPQEDIAITCVLTMGVDTGLVLEPGIGEVLSSTEPGIEMEAEIEDVLRKKIFFMKNIDIELYDDGMTVSVERLSLKEIDVLFDVLQQFFCIQTMYTGDILVFYQTAEEIDENDVVPLESYTGEYVYPGLIHVRV